MSTAATHEMSSVATEAVGPVASDDISSVTTAGISVPTKDISSVALQFGRYLHGFLMRRSCDGSIVALVQRAGGADRGADARSPQGPRSIEPRLVGAWVGSYKKKSGVRKGTSMAIGAGAVAVAVVVVATV